MKATILVALLSLCYTASALAQTLEWTRQLGTTSNDEGFGVSADGAGNVYVSGYTNGGLAGLVADGDDDAFISKYDAGGTLEWTRQLGTSSRDRGYQVSADGLGNVYMAGTTYGSLGGPFAGGIGDAFISKYDTRGTLEWIRQLGTSENDSCVGVSADRLGNVYISGGTRGSLGGPNAFDSWDAFVSKYDAGGTLEWTRQLGGSDYDRSFGVSADGLGNVYISGVTGGNLGGPFAGGSGDVFISKYDAGGTLEWTRQFGTNESEQSYGVSADGLGNVYISGFTRGSLEGINPNPGINDAFVGKYDANGALQWIRQLGTSSRDQSYEVSADRLGNVYFSGRTGGSLDGVSAGDDDAFVGKYDANGTLEWIRQLGTTSNDEGSGVSADGAGNVYISGSTEGSLGGGNAGGRDAFVAKFWADLSQPAADFDFDGDVDGDDFLAWQGGFPTSCCTATKRDGDYDNDGDVDGDDFLGWQSEFGTSGGGAAARRAVPEPSSIVLLIAVLFGVSLLGRP